MSESVSESRSREELPLNCDRDPVRWADEFLKAVEVRCDSEEVLTGKEPLLDKGWLIGWFANAMMCGEDTYRWRQEKLTQSGIGQTNAAPQRISLKALIHKLEGSAANTDTDWRWLAATALRRHPQWETAEIEI